jgi:hypothetical protein
MKNAWLMALCPKLTSAKILIIAQIIAVEVTANV